MSLISRITDLDRGKVKLGLYLISAVFLMGSSPRCTAGPPTIDCTKTTLNVTVSIGTPTQFNNPCGDQKWHDQDNFEVFNLPTGVTLNKDETDLTWPWTLSADGTTPLKSQSYMFTYTHVEHATVTWGEGTMYITTLIPPAVSATANPATIPIVLGTSLGGTSQLNAIARGGVPPYSYAWSPPDTLNNPSSKNPTATPISTTTYTVTVTDSQGLTSSATVTVSFLSLIISAGPTPINPGQSSLLLALVLSEAPPYVYTWSPAASLSNPSVKDPIATPKATTTYQVTATDSSGAQVTGNVTVTVNPVAPPMSLTVTWNLTAPGIVLNAAVSGGTPPYKYAWSPADTLNFANIPNPVAKPKSDTTYTVVVTDATGATATGSVKVPFLN